ncbi:acyl-CoA synthetase [Candidatus Njordibacter sp. Uisw_039]|uniref:acyl-CoA synthetase n=1 Tax=Candidatus Njordibacter sp. Uisw_039 TaxID=3230972 RepID=UPI003D47C411
MYNTALDKNQANFQSLSPLSLLKRAAEVYPSIEAQVYGDLRRTWLQTYQRSCAMANALKNRGVGLGDTVSVVSHNGPELFESHYAVPMAGAVLNAINTRLDAKTIAFIFDHAETKVVFVDREFSETVALALTLCEAKPLVVDIDDPTFEGGRLIGELTYEKLIAEGDRDSHWEMPDDEWQAISLNYTSGTTGNPKGVVYHHRGAYLTAMSMAFSWDMPKYPKFMTIVPMFHCNGWCFPWTTALLAGTNVFIRHLKPETMLQLIRQEKVTHFGGAPIVLNMINNADDQYKQGIQHQVKVMTAGAAPPAAVIEAMEDLGFEVTHVYGLTETYGACVICEWQPHLWGHLSKSQQAALKSRQGVRGPAQEDHMVMNTATMMPVPKDGETIGEICLRGNMVMKGYLKNPTATAEAFEGGWFRTGDLAVWHEDGYMEIKDRAKDIIISGGENISSIEIEGVLYSHPAVLEAAVVARPDEKWGETPCAFITLKPDALVTAEELIGYCKDNMARFKVPKHVVFGALPKTATGKIQKFVLRKMVPA